MFYVSLDDSLVMKHTLTESSWLQGVIRSFVNLSIMLM